jgi:hypothetical protein
LLAPVVLQVEAAIIKQTPAGSVLPAATGAQLPSLPGSAQELQVPQALAAQQNPSVQWVLMQSVPERQPAPFGLRFVHEPAWQMAPAAHCVASVQVVRQAAGPHT